MCQCRHPGYDFGRGGDDQNEGGGRQLPPHLAEPVAGRPGQRCVLGGRGRGRLQPACGAWLRGIRLVPAGSCASGTQGKPSRSLQDPGTTSAHFQIMLKSVEPDEGRVGVSPLQTAAREFHPLPGPRKVAAVSHSDCHPHPSPPSPHLRSSALILSDHVPFQTKWKTAASRKKMILPYHPQRQDNQGFKVGSFCKPSFLT